MLSVALSSRISNTARRPLTTVHATAQPQPRAHDHGKDPGRKLTCNRGREAFKPTGLALVNRHQARAARFETRDDNNFILETEAQNAQTKLVIKSSPRLQRRVASRPGGAAQPRRERPQPVSRRVGFPLHSCALAPTRCLPPRRRAAGKVVKPRDVSDPRAGAMLIARVAHFHAEENGEGRWRDKGCCCASVYFRKGKGGRRKNKCARRGGQGG